MFHVGSPSHKTGVAPVTMGLAEAKGEGTALNHELRPSAAIGAEMDIATVPEARKRGEGARDRAPAQRNRKLS